ncbi:MAG: hypothetical protein ROZ37_20285 [Aromatoleum sp.]|jgi:hypothetical protein|uniref:hypothetical protein n=1 Tax=Aromatoleum sp. TaxID=2307007 RepID=UPI00289385B3|nr:hypothetical protein [Aromatoleum sp.]MDT3672667.1 hypothetical protein [Aromatoleum sp.]
MKRVFALLIPAALTVGCASPVPVAENFALSHQKVARTAHHWDVVADDVVEQTMNAIEDNESLQKRPLYVSAPERHSAFNRAFREFLITRFVASGADVDVCKAEPPKKAGFAADGAQIQVTYDTQVVNHGLDFPDYEPRRFTWLAAGVIVLRRLSEVHLDTAQSGAAALGAGAFADWWLGRESQPTRTEILVTTTIAENNRFVMRRSDIYYVPDADADLFVRWGGKRKSECSEQSQSASSGRASLAPPDEAEVENSRRELVARGMRRINPDWRKSSFSY